MVKRVKGLMIAVSLLMLLSACGKAEADLPGTETEVEVQEEQTQEDLEDPSAMGKEETTGQEEEGTAKQVKIQKHQQIQRLRRFRTMP